MNPTREPLPIPETLDRSVYLLAETTENGTFHQSRRGAAFAASLVANGTDADLRLAERVLDAVLACQERDESDPHYGNFYWMWEDEVVEDLNAVEFVLSSLIPMMIRHGDRLRPSLRERVLAAIRLGLDEIERLDVLVAYSNIAVLDIVNSCLGGALLGDDRIADRGRRKLVEWMAFTGLHGIPYEYNSPTYTAVILRALKRLVALTRDRDTRIRARAMAARLGLSVALHIHAGTGRWTGPHSRAYQPTVACETRPEIEQVREWIADGTLPAWIERALVDRPASFQITETAYAPGELGITTYHSPSFALGVSIREMSPQSNVLIAHYARPGAERAGVLYARYLTNDRWLGSFYHATDRTSSRNLLEEGRFYGVQDGPRAIGIYAPRRLGVASSAKVALIWTQRDLIDEIWVGERRVSDLPTPVADGEVIVIASGSALFGVLPLDHTRLGRDAPVRLAEIGDSLVLEMYNYRGPAKSFWELEWPGGFYRGQPSCAFFIELAERAAYDTPLDLARTIAGGHLSDQTAPAYVYAGQGDRVRRIEYHRGGRRLGIEVDLMQWKLKRRWTHEGELGWPMLDCPVARQSRDGRVRIGDATLECETGPGWLFASPARRLWVAGRDGPNACHLRLDTPEGSVDIGSMGTGTVIWNAGKLTVEATTADEIDLSGTIELDRSPGDDQEPR